MGVKFRFIEWCQTNVERNGSLFSFQSNFSQTVHTSTTETKADHKDPDLPCFTKKEVRDIIFERNELKTNLFLVQEELNYYQRSVHLIQVVLIGQKIKYRLNFVMYIASAEKS